MVDVPVAVAKFLGTVSCDCGECLIRSRPGQEREVTFALTKGIEEKEPNIPNQIYPSNLLISIHTVSISLIKSPYCRAI